MVKHLYRFRVDGGESPGVLRATDESDSARVLLMEIDWRARLKHTSANGAGGKAGVEAAYGWEDLASAAAPHESFTVASNFYIVCFSDQELQAMQRKLSTMRLIPEPPVVQLPAGGATKEQERSADTGKPPVPRWPWVLGILTLLAIMIALARQSSYDPPQPPMHKNSGTDVYRGHPTEPSDIALRATASEFRSGKLAFNQKRYAQARVSFSRACSDGEYLACDYMGYIDEEGLVGRHNLPEARAYYNSACTHGLFVSCSKLGVMYQNAGNRAQAKMYYGKACAAGVADACKWLNGLR